MHRKALTPFAALATLATLAGLTASLPATAAPPASTAEHSGFVSTRPAPRVEHWQRRQRDIATALANPREMAATRLVFLGDSITDFWLFDASPWVRGLHFGRQVWDESFTGQPPENRALNLGVSGDRTEHVLHRIAPRARGGLGQLDAPGLKPDFVIVMLGVNNLWAAEEPVVDSVVAGVRAVLRRVHERQPNAHIVLQSILPAQDTGRNRDEIRPINARLQALAADAEFAGFTTWFDLYPAFVDHSGAQIRGYFTDDLHPNTAGYRVWRDRLVPALAALRTRRP